LFARVPPTAIVATTGFTVDNDFVTVVTALTGLMLVKSTFGNVICDTGSTTALSTVDVMGFAAVVTALTGLILVRSTFGKSIFGIVDVIGCVIAMVGIVVAIDLATGVAADIIGVTVDVIILGTVVTADVMLDVLIFGTLDVILPTLIFGTFTCGITDAIGCTYVDTICGAAFEAVRTTVTAFCLTSDATLTAVDTAPPAVFAAPVTALAAVFAAPVTALAAVFAAPVTALDIPVKLNVI
jgi:hypothetical protein